eukprot:scaffold343_cov245-Pinguiococcus_pyrenoidosus.AAC.34
MDSATPAPTRSLGWARGGGDRPTTGKERHVTGVRAWMSNFAFTRDASQESSRILLLQKLSSDVTAALTTGGFLSSLRRRSRALRRKTYPRHRPSDVEDVQDGDAAIIATTHQLTIVGTEDQAIDRCRMQNQGLQRLHGLSLPNPHDLARTAGGEVLPRVRHRDRLRLVLRLADFAATYRVVLPQVPHGHAALLPHREDSCLIRRKGDAVEAAHALHVGRYPLLVPQVPAEEIPISRA